MHEGVNKSAGKVITVDNRKFFELDLQSNIAKSFTVIQQRHLASVNATEHRLPTAL